MKAALLSLAAISLVQLVSAQPHRRHMHKAAHVKKDEVTVVNTVYAQPTSESEVVVYVNPDGVPVSTVTEEVAVTPTPTPVVVAVASTPAAAVVVVPSSAAPVVVPSSSAAPLVVTKSAAATSSAPAPSSSTSAAPTSSAAAVASGGGYGLTYNPYNSDNSCKTASQVLTDFAAFGTGYGVVRTYGVDCDTVPNVLAAAKAHGLKLFAGIFSLSSLQADIATIVAAAGGDWSNFHTVAIGNELVNSGAADAATVVAAIGTARGLLRTAGFTGPVVTVDTLVATRANPSLCDSSDYCAVNCHPFFDGNTVAKDSGSFLTTQIGTLKAVLSNPAQTIVVTETGWPSQGDPNGVAVPSSSNQEAAISSIRTAFSSNPAGVILFNPYNMHWKTSSAAQFDAEPWWGFLGDCPSG